MLPEKSHRLSANNALFSIILIVNSFIWLSLASKILREVVNVAAFTDYEALMVWSFNFFGAVASIVVGAFLANRVRRRTRFLLFWTLFGIISSIAPLFIGITTITGALAVSSLFSVSLGLGLPACMAEFADQTAIENRARRSGVTYLFMAGLGAVTTILITADIVTSSLILICWKALSLVAFLFVSSNRGDERKRVDVSFISIFRERSFVAFMIPWIMFSLVNYLSAPISVNIHGEELVFFLTAVGNVLTGIFAIVGGFLSDILGRKRITIAGFIMLGIGYAILGIYPLNIFCLYFYTVVDGIAWGIFYVIFFFTIWGDLAYGKPSEKYYALGSLPYILSNFLRITVGPFIANTISAYAVFSFAAFFLFLAVIPLMYAPETLPEKQMRERELKIYIEKAKKVKEKYT